MCRLYGVLRVTRRRVREAAPTKAADASTAAGASPRPTWVTPWDGRPSVPLLRCKNDSTDPWGPDTFAGRRALRFRSPPSSAPFGAPSPWKGEGFRAGGAHPRVASLGLRPIHLQPLPYGITATVAESGRGAPWGSRRWFGKARRGGGTASAIIFRKARAQWPGGDLDQPLRFCAPELFCLAQGVTPVNGVRGKATMSTKCSSGAGPYPLCPFGTSPLDKGSRPRGVLPNPSLLPAKPSEAGSPGRGGARERTQFSPPGGNGVEWTLRRRAAVGKVTRRP